jgi:large subunit ribosomal protein L1
MRKSGKKYVEASKLVDKRASYSIDEAIELAKKTSITKFDSSVELAVKMNLDTKKADQQLRGSLVLPYGNGKTKKILVLAKGAAAEAAKAAGADYVGEQEMIDKIANENWFDFDVIIATPDMMPSLGKIGKVLGPKGLMPNPKTGTVTPTPDKVVADVKKGMIEYRTDKFGNVQCSVGKVSFDDEKLKENIKYVYGVLLKAKPSTVKGKYVQNVSISTTMGPGIHVDENSIDM